MENQNTDEITFDDLSEKEVREVNEIYKRFIKKYKENKDRKVEEWLKEQLQEEMPDIDSDEAEKLSKDIVNSIQEYDKDYADLNEKSKHGVTKEKWLSDKITDAIKGMAVNSVGQQLDEINAVLEMGNRQMERVVMNMDGNISQNPCLDGYMAEQYHVNSFNANAVLEGSPYRARVCEPDGAYGKNSVDIAVDNIKTGEKGILRYQSKYGKDASATEKLLAEGNYNNQRLLVPEEQLKQLKEKFPTKSVTDRIGGVGDVKTQSNPITKEKIKELQKQVQNENNIPKEDWNQYKNEKLALELGKKAGQAGVKAALFASGVGIISKLYKGEEIEADEVVKTALETGADTGIKAAAGGALTVASKKKIINIFPEGTLPSTIAKVACVAVEDAKIMLKVAKGEFTMTEALDKMGRTSVSMYAGLSASAVGTGIGAAALGFIPIVGPILGGVIGGMVGYSAGTKFGQKVYDGAKKVVEKGKELVHKAVDKVRSIGRGLKNAFKSIFS